jgi:hypothetical protein
MVQLHPRSLDSDWSVSVSAARVRGKDEGRVQFPDGPLKNKWGVGPTGRRQLGRLEIRVQFPVGPLLRKVAGYGWPGRFAKPCGAAKCRVGSNPMPSAAR